MDAALHYALDGHDFAADSKLTSVETQQLQMLFESFRRRDDANFVRTAEAIIERELTANHHADANALRTALKNRSQLESTTPRELFTLPKDRRSGEDLIWVFEPRRGLDSLCLDSTTSSPLQRFLEEQRARTKLLSFGLYPKSKLLFWGPPGNGKTVAAEALGHELGLPVALVRLDTVISSYLGDTATHLSRIFSRAAASPMVLFLDEADALGKRRDDPNDVGELKRIVNTLLQLMDGSANNQSVFIAATNHQHLMDPAIWRRFDSVIEFPNPQPEQRRKQLSALLNGVPVSGTLAKAAQVSAGMSFAEIERATKDALKSMIMRGRQTLNSAELTAEIRALRVQLAKARQRTVGTNEP